MSESSGDKIKGRLKEAAGSLTGDEDLKKEGRADQKAGEAKEAAEDLIDKVKGVLTGKGKDKGKK